jgi:hypothetical protein
MFGFLGYYIPRTFFGTWRSPVARLFWEQDVGGSNPLVPTIKIRRSERILPDLFYCPLKYSVNFRVIGQKVCPISGVDAGQRPFFMKKFI